MNDVILYNYFRSSASYRARIALNLKGIAYRSEAVHLLKGEQRSESYLKLNPQGEVPALVHKGRVIAQSLPILEYLDEAFPGPRLFPHDPYARAQVRQFCENINSGLQPMANLKLLTHLEKRHGFSAYEKNAWVAHWTKASFASLEHILVRTAGTYSFGVEITAADLFLVPAVFTAKRFNVDLSAYPLAMRINDLCVRHPAFFAAHPLRQPDAPKA